MGRARVNAIKRICDEVVGSWGDTKRPLVGMGQRWTRTTVVKGQCSPSKHVILSEIAVLKFWLQETLIQKVSRSYEPYRRGYST